MCDQSPQFNGIIILIVGVVFSVAAVLLGFLTVPQLVENAVRKVTPAFRISVEFQRVSVEFPTNCLPTVDIRRPDVGQN